MVLLGFVRRVAADGQFSSARKSLRKLSGSALGVTGRSAKETLSCVSGEEKRSGTAWRHIPRILCHVHECGYGPVVHQHDEKYGRGS